MKTHIQVNSEDEPELDEVWGEVEDACSSIPSLAEPRLHHLAHTLFVVRRYCSSVNIEPKPLPNVVLEKSDMVECFTEVNRHI